MSPGEESSAREGGPGGLSIGARLSLVTVGVLVVASLLLYLELTRRERQSLVAAKATAAAMVADLFAASVAAPLDFADADAIQAELGNLKRNPEVICAAVWIEGQEKPSAEVRGECDAPAPVVDAELEAPVVREDRVEVARIVIGPRGKRVGKARVVFSLARENAAFSASRTRIFWLSALLALGTAAVLLGVTRRQIVLPLGRLAEAARRVGRGDFGSRAIVASGDEIGQLARALNQMSDAIQDREQRLAAATQSMRELLDHMQQAILAFDKDGLVRGEASRQARRIFGKKLEGASIQELLYGGAPEHDVEASAFAEWRAMAFDVTLDKWPELATLAPRDVTLVRPGKSPLPLEVEFRPIAKNGAIERVIVLATDVSEKRRLEKTVEAQEEEYARRMAAMRRLVAGGAQLFVTFTETAREHVAECLARLGPAAREVARADVDAVFRRVHTMRSEARAFDLRELEAAFAGLEDKLAKLREAARAEGKAWTGDSHAALVLGLQRADDAILRAREDFVAASPIGRAALDQMTVQRSDVEELRALLGERDDPVARLVARMAARRFGESTATLHEVVPGWAAREKKQVQLDVDGRDVRVPPGLGRVLGGVLLHLVRNAIAHGIETPLERTREGKEPLGLVRVSAKDGDGGPIIVVEDDGRGLDAAQISARAREVGAADDAAPASELVFRPGVTTRDRPDALAGHGVGLDAVRAELTEVGYAVSIESEPMKSTRYVLRPAGT